MIILPGVGEALRQTKSLIGRSVRSLSAEDSGYFGPGSQGEPVTVDFEKR